MFLVSMNGVLNFDDLASQTCSVFFQECQRCPSQGRVWPPGLCPDGPIPLLPHPDPSSETRKKFEELNFTKEGK